MVKTKLQVSCVLCLPIPPTASPTASWECSSCCMRVWGGVPLCMLGVSLHIQLWPCFYGPSSVWFESNVPQKFKVLEWDILNLCYMNAEVITLRICFSPQTSSGCYLAKFADVLIYCVNAFTLHYFLYSLILPLHYELIICPFETLCISLLVIAFANCAVSLSPQKVSWYESSWNVIVKGLCYTQWLSQ